VTRPNGYPIVLTADKTLMAPYRLLFDGMLAASQTTTTPSALIDMLLLPKSPGRELAAAVAPLGLRRIESALINDGFAPADVIVVAPDGLSQAIGADTLIIGVSAGEPCGMGMNTSTMTGIAGGRIYPAAAFEKLMRKLHAIKAEQSPAAKIVLGGPGTWQLADNQRRCQELGVDHVISGYAEGNIAATFRSVLAQTSPRLISGTPVAAAQIPPIRRASTMGAVEISRGCGLGCKFCTIRNVPMAHLPATTIIADVQTNIRHGQIDIALLSEDFFRYGSINTKADPPALIELLRQLRTNANLRLLQIDHANLLSIAQFSAEQLAEVRNLLRGKNKHEHIWVNLGIETACANLLARNGGAAKMGECAPEHWPDFCENQVRRLANAGFLPMISLILCLPGETPEDIHATRAWIARFTDLPVAIFPLLYAPIDASPAPGRHDLKVHHWELIKACYCYNFSSIPRMYWDNQTAAGVGLVKRLLMQALGSGQMLQWKMLMAWHKLRADKHRQGTCQKAAND